MESKGSHIVAHPPSTPPIPDNLVEDEAYDTPGEVVERRGWRNLTGTTENEGSADHVCTGLGPLLGDEVDDDWSQGTCDPEVLHRGVGGVARKHAGGTDDTPDDGSVEEDATTRAGEVAGLMACADVLDGAHGP